MRKIKIIVKSFSIAFVALIMLGINTARADFVDGFGSEWLDVSSLTAISHNSLDAACNVTGKCTGIHNGINLEGYEWASISDVDTLYQQFGPDTLASSQPTKTIQDDNFVVALGLDWVIRASLSGVSGSSAALGGLVNEPLSVNGNTTFVSGSLFGPGVNVRSDWHVPTATNPSLGAFLFKSISGEVPEPSMLALIGLGLLGLFGIRRRKVQL